jgi:beta-glucosidase
MTPSSFHANFLWGAATAAYQIEGSPTADGKGPSIWEMMTRKEGAIGGATTGDTQTLKASAHWYREVIRTHGTDL